MNNNNSLEKHNSLPARYGMFSRQADRKIRTALTRILKAKRAQSDPIYLAARLRVELNKIRVKHGEVMDTDVREQVLYALVPFSPAADLIATSELY